MPVGSYHYYMFHDICSCDTEICNEFLNLKSHDQLILIKILLYHITLHLDLEITQKKIERFILNLLVLLHCVFILPFAENSERVCKSWSMKSLLLLLSSISICCCCYCCCTGVQGVAFVYYEFARSARRFTKSRTVIGFLR